MSWVIIWTDQRTKHRFVDGSVYPHQIDAIRATRRKWRRKAGLRCHSGYVVEYGSDEHKSVEVLLEALGENPLARQ